MSQFQRGDEPSGYVHLLHTVLSESSHVESLHQSNCIRTECFSQSRRRLGETNYLKQKSVKNKVIKIKHIKDKNMTRK